MGALPPFVGVAVNVTAVPEQIVVWDALMLTDGVTAAFTVIVMLLLLAELCVTQASALVIVTLMISPFTKLALL